MKILGIDVSSKGIKIPFSNFRIPTPIFVTGLISLFGVPTTATNITNNSQPIDNGVFRPYGSESNFQIFQTGGYPTVTDSFLMYAHQFTQFTKLCSPFEMQYFDNCVIESSESFESSDFNLRSSSFICKVKLSCVNKPASLMNEISDLEPLDRMPENRLLTVVYINRYKMKSDIDKLFEDCNEKKKTSDKEQNQNKQQFDTKIIKEKCSIAHSMPFVSIDPSLRTLPCEGILDCVMVDGVTHDPYFLSVLYEGRKVEQSYTAENDNFPSQSQSIVYYPPRIEPANHLLTSHVGRNERFSAKDLLEEELGYILPKFPDIVANVLNELFPPRLNVERAKRFASYPPTFLIEAIRVGVKEKLSEEGLKEDLRHLSAIICFRSSIDKLSKEFSEEYSAMMKAIGAAQLVDQCQENLGPNFPLPIELACVSEFMSLGEAVEGHIKKNIGLATMLKVAAKDCSNDIASSPKNEARVSPAPKTENQAIAPSFREMVTDRLRQYFSMRLIIQFLGFNPGLIRSSLSLHGLNLLEIGLGEAMSVNVEETLKYYNLLRDSIYSNIMRCFDARIDSYSKECSEEFANWQSTYEAVSQADRMCVKRLELKERQEAELLRKKWIDLALSYAKSFESNSLEIPKGFEKQWFELESQQLVANEQKPCGESFKKAVNGTTLYYFQSNAISIRIEQATEECHQQAKRHH